MNVFRAQSATDAERWENFIEAHADADKHHRWAWKQVVENSFGWPTYYLIAEEARAVRGILPLVWQRSRVFGSFLTSMPFFNSGGILADDAEAEHALLKEAICIARTVGAQYIELRHRRPYQLGLLSSTRKISLMRPVEADTEKMFRELDKKVRTDIRKALKSRLVSEHGGSELVDDFYSVFAQNMRDLGTPVYGKNFFVEILRAFPCDTFITVVRHDGKAVASSFLTAFRRTIEAVWSSSVRGYLPLKPNMLLYWKNLCLAGELGYSAFDFGRSSPGSGTHKFKIQWGTTEVQLYWDYWLARGDAIPRANPESQKNRMAIHIWQKLPLWVTLRLGPRIAPCLPW
jgi:serine/alanine adding enzyme